ncbi:unnamed protein product [Medioppia subpectinata]|uniref:SEC63 domain-containing protein n=1 Tax=Medioppia subpectinata TaxID=1979941 RepID=A0A7R9KZC8_9ACAR|nr:unnamed protein product [Medioppia subpectinata]CAG2112703.1 unnamed protein product [Medioppia subpectinata]
MKFNELISDMMDERAIFAMIATAQEFDQLKSREDEFEELEDLLRHECQLGVPGGVENKNGKVNILMQSQLSRAKIDSFSLVSDTMFVMQNVNRIARGLFDYVVKKGWALLAEHLLRLSLMFERRQWAYETPLRQFGNEISFEVMCKLERLKPPLTIELIKQMTADDLGRLVRHTSYGSILKRLADTLPSVAVEACIKPITRTVLMVEAMIKPTFRWDDRHHGKGMCAENLNLGNGHCRELLGDMLRNDNKSKAETQFFRFLFTNDSSIGFNCNYFNPIYQGLKTPSVATTLTPTTTSQPDITGLSVSVSVLSATTATHPISPPVMKTQPQWTGGRVSDYIRTYGNISRPPNEFDECDDRQFYRLQRHRVLQQTQRNSLAHWPDVRDCFTDGLRAARRTGDHRRDHVSDKECQDLLRRALDIGREFVGIGAAMDLVESAAVYVLQVFHDAKYMKSTPGVTAQQVHELVTMFGEEEVNTQLVNGAYECAKTLLDLMDTEDRERLFMPFRSRPQFNGRRSLDGYNVANNGGTGDDIYDPLARYKDVEEWSDYKYKDLDIDPFKERYTFEEMCAIVPRMPFTRAADRSAAERNDKPKGYELSFQYKNTANECQQKSQMASQGSVKKPVKYVKYSEYMSANTTANTAATQRESDVYDVEWLNRELNKYIDNYFQKNSEQFYMNIETLADTVMDWVQSDGKSDEELAGDLHSLLGDDCLPLIEKLVKYRQRVKESYKQVYCDQMGGSADTTANTDQSHGPRGWSQLTRDKALAVHVPRERGPAIAPSVVVQTSEEKNLKKQMRKLEKKLNKELYREGEEQVSPAAPSPSKTLSA